ncbi:MAG: hypothetical protein AAF492_07065 [Verrucomicrobiota bacterium]
MNHSGTLSVLVANLSLGAGKAHDRMALARLWSELIADIRPEIVLTQEAGRGLSYHTTESDHDYLGRITTALEKDYRVVFSPAVLLHPAKRARMQFGEGEVWSQGLCLFLSTSADLQHLDLWTRSPLAHPMVDEMHLPRPAGSYLYQGDRSSEPRLVQVMRCRLFDEEILFVNVHLTTLKGERENHPEIDREAEELRGLQLAEIEGAVKALAGPETLVLIAGDFNAGREELLRHSLTAALAPLVDGKTRPAGRISVDNILLSRDHRFRQVRVSILDDRRMSPLIECGADHYPLLVELKV